MSALLLGCGRYRAVLLSVDHCGISEELAERYCKAIEAAIGIGRECIFLAATHTHTGPLIKPSPAFCADEAVIEKYAAFLGQRLVDMVLLAGQDM